MLLIDHIDELFAFDIIFVISFDSFASLNNSFLSLDKLASSIISNQYSDSSASSTTIQILLKNSDLDRALHAAR